MYAFLLSLSVISTAIGVFAIGFGVPNHEFGLGNTLIVSGAVAVVGGMVMLGLAAAVRQLRRIADGLAPRPAAPRRQAVAENGEAPPVSRQAPAQRIPYPPRPDAREGRSDARPAVPQAADLPEPPPMPMERPRPNIFGVARAAGDPPEMEEPEAVPLAPNRMPAAPMPAAPMGRGAPPMAEPPSEPRSSEPRSSPADIMARLSNLAASPPRPAPRPEPPRAPAPTERPATEQRPRPNMFDALWPAEVRAARQSQPETIARAPKPDLRSEPSPEPRQEPKVDVKPEPKLDIRPEPKPEFKSEFRPEFKPEFRPEPRSEPRPEPRPDLRFEPPMARERNEPAVNVALREQMAPPVAEPRPIAILKSGVIDGMAYTLYTDGSIEAELPQGTMRFGSIDELRAHLEKTERQD
jgi:hypothetical protein